MTSVISTSTKFALGQQVYDRHSGIEGSVYMIELCLYREPRYQILRNGVNSNGEHWPEQWFFEGRLDAA